NLTPRSAPPQGQGAIGILLQGGLVRLKPVAAVGQGFIQTVRAIGATLSVPKMLIEGSLAPADARLIGLVGMAQATSETVSYVVDTGFWYPLFVLTGLFSAGLSIANMLPIPALDGGRLFFVILEWIRGRRIPPEREAAGAPRRGPPLQAGPGHRARRARREGSRQRRQRRRSEVLPCSRVHRRGLRRRDRPH